MKKLPPLYSQEKNSDPLVLCKFFDPTGSWTWYVIEGEQRGNGDWLFFGYVIGDDAELGYFSLFELQTAKQRLAGLRALPIERDVYFTPCPLSKVRQEAKAF